MKSGIYPVTDTTILDRAAAIVDKHGPRLNQLIEEACRLAQDSSTPVERFDGLFNVAESLSKLLTAETVCKSGCSHCCYMAVSISDFEADMIGRYIGKEPAIKGSVENFLKTADENIEAMTGVPCSFLSVEGKCTIYPVRPITCRTHHNLALTSDPCRVKDVPEPDRLPTSMLNLHEISGAAVAITMQAGHGFADIREYFPTGAA